MSSSDSESVVDRILAELERWAEGLHEIGHAARDLPPTLPLSAVDVYLAFDGARLFQDAIELVPAAALERDDDGRWRIGTAWGDELALDADGRVWRHEDDAGELVLDGTSLGRWLHGAIDAEALLYDADGEFAEDVFDDDGELTPPIEEAQLRARIKRDGKAPGPRWRLGRLLARRGDVEPARDVLEQVVADAPAMAWAWLDLARLSEQLGEHANAVDEAVAAAEASPEHAGFFFAHAARLAVLAGDEPRRAELAARARDANPHGVADYVAGAADNLAAGDLDAARALADLAKAVAPRDLAVLDLVRKLPASED